MTWIQPWNIMLLFSLCSALPTKDCVQSKTVGDTCYELLYKIQEPFEYCLDGCVYKGLSDSSSSPKGICFAIGNLDTRHQGAQGDFKAKVVESYKDCLSRQISERTYKEEWKRSPKFKSRVAPTSTLESEKWVIEGIQICMLLREIMLNLGVAKKAVSENVLICVKNSRQKRRFL